MNRTFRGQLAMLAANSCHSRARAVNIGNMLQDGGRELPGTLYQVDDAHMTVANVPGWLNQVAYRISSA